MEGKSTSEVESEVAFVKAGEGNPPKGDKKCGKSKDVLSSMEARMALMETAIAEMRDQFDLMGDSMEGYEKEFEDLKGSMQGTLNEVVATLHQEKDALEAKLMGEIDDLRA